MKTRNIFLACVLMLSASVQSFSTPLTHSDTTYSALTNITAVWRKPFISPVMVAASAQTRAQLNAMLWGKRAVPAPVDVQSTFLSFYNYRDDNFTKISNAMTYTATVAQTDTVLFKHNGTWYKTLLSLLAPTGWKLNGNTVGAEKFIGTLDNYDLPFRTNNTEVARFTSTGYFHLGNTSRGQIDVSGSSTLLLSSISASIDIGLTNQVIGGLRGGNSSGLDIRPYSAGTADVPLTFSAYNGSGYIEYFKIKNTASGYSNMELCSSGGKVAIGTTNPTAQFQVVSPGTTTSTYVGRFVNGNGTVLDMRDDDQTTFYVRNGAFSLDNGAGYFIGFSFNENVMDWNKSNGERFQIRQGSNNLQFNAIGADRSFYFGSNGTSLMALIGVDRSVGINNSNPQANIDVVGNGATSATSVAKFSNSTPTAFFTLRNDKRIVYADGNEGNGKLLTSDGSGVATWQTLTSINGLDVTATGSGAALTIAPGKELTCNNQLQFEGTDATTFTFPAGSGNVFAATVSINTTAGDAATINEKAGRFRKDNSGTTFTLTDSYITANSIILLTIHGNQNGVATLSVTPGSGSADITFNAAPGANTDVNFIIVN
jgi:hypothetical protein